MKIDFYKKWQDRGVINLEKKRGAFLPVIVMVSTLFIALIVAVIAMAMTNIKTANNHRDKVLAMEVAEAGVNYYLWHLAHNNTDYCDGKSCVGDSTAGYKIEPHEYRDVSERVIGNYELTIFPPSDDSTVVRIESIGRINGRSLKRKIICELGMPSFSKYTLFVQSEELWLGPNEKISGTVLVNGSGIYNQGEITKDSYSTESTYDSVPGGNNVEGISGPGIFGGSKNFPVAPVNFNQLDVDMTALRDAAKNEGKGLYFDTSGSNGYHLVLKDSSFDLYRVTQYYGSFREDQTGNSDDLSIRNQTLIGNYSYPDDGIIFLEDNIWIDGKVNDEKITIIACDPEETRANYMKSIIVPDNLLYTNYAGKDKIGLLSQNYIYIPRKAPTNLEIDAAMIAYAGSIRIKPYCSPSFNCSNDKKTKIKVFGSMAHKGGLWWTIEYGGGKWSGYQSTETVIDESNVLNPPPSFPVTGSYTIMSWREE